MLTDLPEPRVLVGSATDYDRDRITAALSAMLGDGPLVPTGSRVLIKPNWVHHVNAGPGGMTALVTQTALVAAVLELLVTSRPASVIVGDAPIQGCDFGALGAELGLDQLAAEFAPQFDEFDIVDFRRTIRSGVGLGGHIEADVRPLGDYVLFDLARDSELEPISAGSDFRVTMYDPRALERTHRPGRHQYLIARQVIDADVIIDMPKIKTHRKSGVTGSLKNLVGVNGNKDYLAHHRKGGAGRGDNYQGRRPLKRVVEELQDAANRTESARVRGGLGKLSGALLGLDSRLGGDGNIDGSWYGNDTVWRMALDLVRVVRYGRTDGSMADAPQRSLVCVSDGIVAGEGEGPLAPSALPLGRLVVGSNAAAVEWVHALLMGFEPTSLPIVRQAFEAHRWPLAEFAPDGIEVQYDGEPVDLDDVWEVGRAFNPPTNWRGHVERRS